MQNGATGRVYIHETIAIDVQHRQRYLEHFCSWGKLLREHHGVDCFGVWATVGSTAAWPEAVCMWELPELDTMAAMLAGEFAFLDERNDALPEHWELWWSNAPEGVVATGGFDRLVIATPETPGIHDWLTFDPPTFAGYYQETVTTPPGAAPDYLAEMTDRWLPIAHDCGARLIGSYVSMFRNDSEALTLWGFGNWRDWTAVEHALRADGGDAWRRDLARRNIDWNGKLLTAAPRSPLKTKTPL